MSIDRRDIVVLVLAVALVPLLAERLQWWLEEPLLDASAPPLLAGVPSLLIVPWVVGVGLFSVVGVFLAALLRARRVAWWALAFGLTYGVLRFATYTVHVSPVVGWATALFIYGGIFVAPALGAVLGAVSFRALRSALHRSRGHAA